MSATPTADRPGAGPPALSPATRAWLLDRARAVVAEALADGSGAGSTHRPPDRHDPAAVPSEAAAPGAAFVTLRRDGRLLGCIGTMAATRPLADDVAAHALDAAFRDPRLPAVTADDLPHLEVEVSVLGPLEVLDVHDRAGLAAALRPGVDGVLLESAEGRGTFLPSVWQQVDSPAQFLDQLWRKAGLRPGRWPADLVVERYQVTEFGAGPAPLT